MSNYYKTRYTYDSGRSKVWRAISEFLQKFINCDSDTVLDLGAGYCDFINNIKARNRFALDLNPDSSSYCDEKVSFICSSALKMDGIPNNSIDVIFASNLLEHFDNSDLDLMFNEFERVLVGSGRVILLQPNFRFAYKEYFDDYTHKKVFSHVSLANFLESKGYVIIALIPKFLPFSLKSRLPKSYYLTKLYLFSFFRPMAKQMLIVAQKKEQINEG